MLLPILATCSTLEDLSLGNGVVSHGADHSNFFDGASNGGVPSWLFLPSPDTNLNGVPAAFRLLQRLDLTICFTNIPNRFSAWYCPLNQNENMRGLGLMLSEADNLEELKLNGHTYSANLKLEEILTSKMWRKLRVLELRYFETTLADAVGLLRRHKESLRKVRLDSVNFLDGNWLDLHKLVALELPEVCLALGRVWFRGRDYFFQSRRRNLYRGAWENVLFGYEYYPSRLQLHEEAKGEAEQAEAENLEEYEAEDNVEDEVEAKDSEEDEMEEDVEDDVDKQQEIENLDHVDNSSVDLDYDSGSDGWGNEDLTYDSAADSNGITHQWLA